VGGQERKKQRKISAAYIFIENYANHIHIQKELASLKQLFDFFPYPACLFSTKNLKGGLFLNV
jgi:hypothetical protein